MTTKLLLFKVDYEREPRMDFEIRKWGKHMKVEKFVKEMKEIHEEAKSVLKKSQEEMKEYVDKNRKEIVEYKVEDGILLSIKNLMWQIGNRKMKKLIEKFVVSYKIKKIILENMVELELLVSIKTYLEVNISKIVLIRSR